MRSDRQTAESSRSAEHPSTAPYGDAFIEARLLEDPTLVSQQLCDEDAAKFGVRVSTATMKRHIHELGYT